MSNVTFGEKVLTAALYADSLQVRDEVAHVYILAKHTESFLTMIGLEPEHVKDMNHLGVQVIPQWVLDVCNGDGHVRKDE